ncbi:MAG TPA: 16S rRNA (guanine(966)-N(2))-methyltransferase RsmD [Treponemataceae bacterium]|nr:16S rRNA (guanine(966)-N(2))-methyltransferase RsmD [Treponemataceae bacterium]
MRITGGKLKGANIKCPKGVIRPAMDRMRESFFSILGNLEGKTFLDTFSGSATVAIEAVSRGAKEVTLCERDTLKISTILNNVKITETRMNNKIVCKFQPVELFLKRTKEQYDIIFCDPPFPYKFHENLIKIISTYDLITDNGVVLIHYPGEKPMKDRIGNLIKTEKREYGRSTLGFYKKRLD